MNIGIDIDDTIADAVEIMTYYGAKYNIEDLGKSGEYKHKLGKIENGHGYMEILFDWSLEVKMQFFDKYYGNIIREMKPLKNVSEVIDRLQKEGHKIYFISARFRSAEEDNLKWFEDNKISYDGIFIDTQSKLEKCKELKIDLFIDDGYEVCKKTADHGIKTYLMNSIVNEKIICQDNIIRVYSWDEIYQKIQGGK